MSLLNNKKTKQDQANDAKVKGIVVGEAPSGVVGEAKSNLGKRVTIKPWKLALALLLVIIIAGGTVYWVRKSNTSTEVSDVTPAEFTGDAATVANDAYYKEQQGDTKGALAAIDDYLSNNQGNNSPEVAWVYSIKADLEIRYVNAKSALISIQKAIEIAPSDPRYYAQAGDYYLISGDEQKSTESYNKALEVYDAGLPDGYDGPDREFFAQKVNGATSN